MQQAPSRPRSFEHARGMASTLVALSLVATFPSHSAAQQHRSDLEAVLFWVYGIENFQIGRLGGDVEADRIHVPARGFSLIRSAKDPCVFLVHRFNPSNEEPHLVFDFKRVSAKYQLTIAGQVAKARFYGEPIFCAMRPQDAKPYCNKSHDRMAAAEIVVRQVRALQYIQEKFCPGIPAPPGWNFRPDVPPY